jgi:Protein of unknown function (DUF1566)
MWARQDNGSSVNWNQANNYCSNLRLGGYTNWRLGTVDELAGIYDQTQDVKGWHIKGGIQLSGWTWSNSQGSASGEAWGFGFNSGKRASVQLVYYSIRALCVRCSGE